MNHGRSYGLCKKIVAVGKMGKEQMLEKFDVLVLSGGLTEDDYTERWSRRKIKMKKYGMRIAAVVCMVIM